MTPNIRTRIVGSLWRHKITIFMAMDCQFKYPYNMANS